MIDDIQPKLLKDITYEQFKEFLDSLDEERKSWSLDLQHHKNEKEFYNHKKRYYSSIVVVDKEKVIGLCDYYYHTDLPHLIELSFVVKKGYQGIGIGTKMLLTMETLIENFDYKYSTAKHYKDNIASHKAFLKAGYEKWTVDKIIPIRDGSGRYFYRKEMIDDDTFDWKIKEIG